MVNGIGEMLGLKTECRMVGAEAHAARAHNIMQVIAGVELDTRLRGEHFQRPAGSRDRARARTEPAPCCRFARQNCDRSR